MKVLVVVLLIVVALVISGAAGTLMMRDPGLVVISYGGHIFETGLWTFLLVVVVAWLLIRFLLSTLASILSSGKIFGRFRANRRLLSAKKQTEQGLLLMAEEEWADARKSLVSGAKGAATPLLNFLQAAYASHELGQTKRRDDLLEKALKATPEAQFALDLAAARMQLTRSNLNAVTSEGPVAVGDASSSEDAAANEETATNEEVDRALETLLKLRDQAPRHQIVAEFIARAYEKKGDYSKLESQLSGLKRMRREHPADVERMELAIARHKVIGAFAKDSDAPGAVTIWKRQDKAIRLNPAFVQDAAATLAAGGAAKHAGEMLVDALSSNWNSAWLEQFVNLPGIEKLQARQAETWLRSNAGDPQVLLLAARAEAAKGEWQKAREYAAKGDEIAPSAALRVELARAEAALQKPGEKTQLPQENRPRAGSEASGASGR